MSDDRRVLSPTDRAQAADRLRPPPNGVESSRESAQPGTSAPSNELARLAGAIVALACGVLVLGAVYLASLVPWTLVLALFSFLEGPKSSIAGMPYPLVLAPPLGATLALVVWFGRTLRSGRLPALSETAVAHARHWIGPRSTIVLLGLGLLVFCAFARLVFMYARIQGAIDEGLYLYAARLAMAGAIPYRDFYFDQAPLLPYAFGVALGAFQYDEVAARVFATLCTLLTLLATYCAAARLGGRLAGVVAFGLLLSSLDFISELPGGVQSNGSLTALCVALVAVALAYQRLGLALVLASLAAGLRQVFVPLPLILAFYVAFGKHRPWLGLLGGIAPVGVVYGVSLAVGSQAALLALVRPLRQPYVVRMTTPTDFTYALADLSTTFQQALAAYVPILLCAGPVAYLALRWGHPRRPTLLVLAVSSALVLVANLFAYPANPRYPVTQLPLAAILGGVGVVALYERASAQARGALLAGLASLLVISPLNAYRGADFVAQFQNTPPLTRFLAAAAYVRNVAPPGGTLVTLETPFASQTGLRLPRGLEAGSWGIYGKVSPERARELGVVTYPMLVDMVEQGVGDVVISSDRYGFVDNYANNDAEKQRLQHALETGYELKETFGNVSDWGNVKVWIKRASAGPAPNT